MGYINKVQVGSDTHLIEPTLYGTSNTAAGTGTKVVSIDSDFALVEGVQIYVKFDNTNSAAVSGLKLNVNSTGAIPIKCNGSNLSASSLLTENCVHSFIYDGTNWEYLGPSMIRQGVSTTTSWRNILLGININSAANTTATENYGLAYTATGVSVKPSTGALYAKSFEPQSLSATAETGTLHTTKGTFPFAVASTNLLTDITNGSADYAGLQIGSTADTWQIVAYGHHLYIRQNDDATSSSTWSSGWTSWHKLVNNDDLSTGTTNGTIKLGDTEIAVAGLGSAAYAQTTDFASSTHNHDDTYLPLIGGTLTGPLALTGAASNNANKTGKGINWFNGENPQGHIGFEPNDTATSATMAFYTTGQMLFRASSTYDSGFTATTGMKLNGSALMPTGNMDLGTSSTKWNNVYATNFKGNADSASEISASLAQTTKIYLLGTSEALAATAKNVSLIGDSNVYLTASEGELSAVSYSWNVSGVEKAHTEYDATNDCINFIFD